MQSSQEQRPPRSDRLPRRRTDRLADLAAWVLTAAGLLVLLWGGLGGAAAYREAVDLGRAAEQERTHVEAVLRAGGATVDVTAASLSPRSASYVDPASREHVVVVGVVGRPPAGTVVRLWLDREGNLAPAPVTRFQAVVLGVAEAAGIVLIGVGVLAALWLGVRRWVERRTAAAWVHEWAEVEPIWSGRVR